MMPQLVTLMGSECCGAEEPSAEDMKVAAALVSLAKMQESDRAALMGEYPELMGIAPWIAAIARVAKKVGKGAAKLTKRVAKAVRKARKSRVAKAARKMVASQRATDAPAAESALAPMPGPGRGLPKNALLIGGAAALVALLVFARRK